MPGQDKTKYKKSSTKDNRDQANEFASVKKKNKIKQANEFSGTGKSSKRSQVNEFSGLGKKKEPIKQANEFSGTSKTSKTSKTGGSKTKPKVVTPAMIKAKGFTTLRDYLNNEQGLKRRDGKKVVKTTKTNKTSDDKKTKKIVKNNISAKASNDAQSTQKVISKKTQTDFKKSGAFKGTDEAPGDNKKAKKKSSFFDSIGSGIKKAVKETKRNFEGDFKKKTGKYKLISKGTSNIIGSKNFVSDKKKKK